MNEPVPIMDEPTHDKITKALQHLSVEHYGAAEETLHEALDRLEDGVSWDQHTGTEHRVAYTNQEQA